MRLYKSADAGEQGGDDKQGKRGGERDPEILGCVASLHDGGKKQEKCRKRRG